MITAKHSHAPAVSQQRQVMLFTTTGISSTGFIFLPLTVPIAGSKINVIPVLKPAKVSGSM